MANRATHRDYLYLSPHAAEVESDVRDHHRVRQVGDRDLAQGDWFESPGLSMAYGVQAARRSTDTDTAVFVGQIDEHTAAESSLLLGGPAEYLQDTRRATPDDMTGDMSYPSALFTLLASLSDRDAAERPAHSGHDRRAPSHRQTDPQGEQAREEQWLAVGYPIAAAHSFFGQHGFHPLTFVARAANIVHFESDGIAGRWILGTPLWVALRLPD